jgi:hypothetical protein
MVIKQIEKRLIPTIQGLSESEINERFEDFWSQIDIQAIERLPNQPMDALHKELMKQSFIRHDGYFYPNEVWPEKFYKRTDL